jgi:zinc transport system substrate-binding protein
MIEETLVPREGHSKHETAKEKGRDSRNRRFGRSRLRSAFQLAALLLLAAALSACGGQTAPTLQEGKVNAVATFYTLYDFASRIGGDQANVINPVPAGVDSHDWAPKSRDLQFMSKAQLFIYNGAGLEGWVGDFAASLRGEGPLMIEASAGIELLRGGGHDHDHADGSADSNEDAKSGGHAQNDSSAQISGHDHDGEPAGRRHIHSYGKEIDPHVWVSPKSALKMAENIKNGFVQADPANRAVYEANYEKLRQELAALDAKFRESIAKAPKKEIVVSHNAFGYLARDYGLTQMPIMGLSPDAEPTAQDLKRISDFIKEHGVKYILVEELVSDRAAKMLANDLGIETLVLNPLEGLTEKQAKAGENYVTMMESNLQNLLKALQ